MAALHAALDALERCDPASLSDGELHELVVAGLRLSSRLDAVRAGHVAVWDRRRVWADDGSRAAWSRLARECGLHPGRAKREVRRAGRLCSLPVTRAAFLEGKLSVDQ